MDITVVIEKMIMLFLIMMLGYLGRKMKIFDDNANRNFSTLVVNITMPCLMLGSISIESGIGKTEVLQFLGISAAVYIGLAVFAFFITKALRVKKEDEGTFQFMTIFSNNGFMGFPVIQAILGREALLLATILNLPISVMMYSYGVFIIGGGRGNGFRWKRFLNPGVVAAIVALILYLADFQWPTVAGDVLESVGNITTPMAMIVLGASLVEVPFGKMLKEIKIYVFCFIRLILEPILVYLLISRLFDNYIIWGVLVVTAGMPSATATVMICTEYGRSEETASKYVFMSTVISVVTIPILAYLLF